MIRGFISDWGNVLMRTVDIRPRMAWERRLGLSPGALADAFFGSELWDQAQRGDASVNDVWADVAQRLNLDGMNLSVLRRDFWAGDRLDEELVALLREVRALGLKTGLLSNHPTNLRRLLARHELMALFDAVVISAEEGLMKPDPAIYRLILERLGLAPEEAVFVDDWRPNVEAAQALGMTGIHFRGTLHLRRALIAAGLPLRPPKLGPIPGIRAVIFDWGGVLSPLSFLQRAPEWESRLGLPEGTVNAALWGEKWKLLEIRGHLPGGIRRSRRPSAESGPAGPSGVLSGILQ